MSNEGKHSIQPIALIYLLSECQLHEACTYVAWLLATIDSLAVSSARVCAGNRIYAHNGPTRSFAYAPIHFSKGCVRLIRLTL